MLKFRFIQRVVYFSLVVLVLATLRRRWRQNPRHYADRRFGRICSICLTYNATLLHDAASTRIGLTDADTPHGGSVAPSLPLLDEFRPARALSLRNYRQRLHLWLQVRLVLVGGGTGACGCRFLDFGQAYTVLIGAVIGEEALA